MSVLWDILDATHGKTAPLQKKGFDRAAYDAEIARLQTESQNWHNERPGGMAVSPEAAVNRAGGRPRTPADLLAINKPETSFRHGPSDIAKGGNSPLGGGVESYTPTDPPPPATFDERFGKTTFDERFGQPDQSQGTLSKILFDKLHPAQAAPEQPAAAPEAAPAAPSSQDEGVGLPGLNKYSSLMDMVTKAPGDAWRFLESTGITKPGVAEVGVGPVKAKIPLPANFVLEGKNILSGILGLPERAIKAAQESPIGDPSKDLIAAGADTALTTLGVRSLGGAAPGTTLGVGAGMRPPKPPIKVFHGTNRPFSEFDLSKVGTGEATRGGFGIYFTDDAEYSKIFPVLLKARQARRALEKTGATNFTSSDLYAAHLLEMNWGNVDQALAGAADAIDPAATRAAIKKLALEAASEGKLYSVNLELSPSQLLQADLPFSQQSEVVRNALRGLKIHEIERALAAGKDPAGSRLIEWAKLDTEQGALAVRALGVKGMQYKIGRRDGGSGYEYVVFDPKAARIVGEVAAEQAAATASAAADAVPPKEAPPGGVEKGIADAFQKDIAGRGVGGKPPEPPAPPPEPPAGAPPPDFGPTPSRDFTTSIEDRLYKLRTNAAADDIELRMALEDMPPDVAKATEKLYLAREDPQNYPLTPRERALEEQYVAPWRAEADELYKKAKALSGDSPDIKQLDPNYQHRMAKGQTPQFDTLTGGAAVNPVLGRRSLAKTTSSLKDRTFYALEAPDGTRKVVSAGKDGVYVFDNGKATLIKSLGKDLVPGSEVSAGGKVWKVTQARTPEIEKNTNVQYYKDAVSTTLDNVSKLRKVVRNLEFTKELQSTPEWLHFATRAGGNTKIPPGWKTVNAPGFHGWYMDPKMANPILDFIEGTPRLLKGAAAEALEKVNRLAVGSLFWNPIPHIQNVGAHWFVARGWDNFTPKGMYSLLADGTRALKAVISQNKDYVDLLREGSALISSGLTNRNLTEFMLKKMGNEIQAAPGAWAAVAKAAGYTGVPQLIKAIYSGAAKTLWKANDVFMLQRVFELERKGMTRADAIKHAEDHIPNYRLPSEIAGSRILAQIMGDPNLTIFSRYHYGIFKSYARMARDIVKGSPQVKMDALGNVMALGFLMFGAYPILDAAVRKATGNPDAKVYRRGATTVPENIIDLTTGQKDLTQVLSGILTPAPATQETFEQFFNRDMFTGGKIGVGGPLQQFYERGSHAIPGLLAPAQQAGQIAKTGVIPFAEQSIGISDPSPDQLKARKYFQDLDKRTARKRAKKEPLRRFYGGPP